MQLTLLKGKIHRCTVTDADVNYEGSVTISEELMVAAQITQNEQVHIWNVSTGTRLITYAMRGPPDSGVICINGAAAHIVSPGDVVIIAAFVTMDIAEATVWNPSVVFVDDQNQIQSQGTIEYPGPKSSSAMPKIVGIDHLALAVSDLEGAISWCKDLLGCELAEQRETVGKFTGMRSAVMKLGPFTLVLTQGVGTDSQISKFVEHHGPGVQHVALRVRDIEQSAKDYTKRGIKFITPILKGPGLAQIFSERNPETGLMVELIERTGCSLFADQNVDRLFAAMEEKAVY